MTQAALLDWRNADATGLNSQQYFRQFKLGNQHG